ncbi:MAG: hypothetical protein ACE5JS_13220 [Nitrospinota bacterium]
MAEETGVGPFQVKRDFEVSPDAISLYSDFANVVNLGNEVILQFFETIPGAPGPSGQVNQVTTRLRATITLSFAHAKRIGELLLQHIEARP